MSNFATTKVLLQSSDELLGALRNFKTAVDEAKIGIAEVVGELENFEALDDHPLEWQLVKRDVGVLWPAPSLILLPSQQWLDTHFDNETEQNLFAKHQGTHYPMIDAIMEIVDAQGGTDEDAMFDAFGFPRAEQWTYAWPVIDVAARWANDIRPVHAHPDPDNQNPTNFTFFMDALNAHFRQLTTDHAGTYTCHT